MNLVIKRDLDQIFKSVESDFVSGGLCQTPYSGGLTDVLMDKLSRML